MNRDELIDKLKEEIEWARKQYLTANSISEPGLADSLLNYMARLHDLLKEIIVS